MAVNWDGSHIPSQRDRIAIVTGSANGLGYECARHLVERGACVVIADYDETRARQSVQDQRTLAATIDGAGDVEFLRVDMGCVESVQAFATTLHNKMDHVDVLINNAGVGIPTEHKCTDGYAIQFGVNHLGHFYLTLLLFDFLRKATAARVVNVTSIAHRQDILPRGESIGP